MTYDYGGQQVTFTGDHVTIAMGDHTYHVSWTVYMVSNSGLREMHLKNISYSRIDTPYQNSAILTANNSYIRIAEIFTFGTAMDASIAVKNLMKGNETYEIMFEMRSSNHHSMFYINGFDPASGSMTHETSFPGTGYAMIPSDDWSLTMGHVNVNWQNEMSIFHVGTVATDPDSSSVTLPFGPVTLMGNETYSVDPVIRPSIIHVCACGGGGGGGGISPPTIGSFSTSYYPATFENGTEPITFEYDVFSLGSYSYVKVGFFMESMSYSYHIIGSTELSSTGSKKITLTPNLIGQWDQFGIAVYYDGSWNFQGYYGHSFIIFENTAYPYDYPNSGYIGGNMKPVYNSEGKIVGDMFGSIQFPNVIQPGYSAKYELLSGIATKNNNYEVSKMGMYFNYTGNSISQSPSYMESITGLQQYPYYSSYQNYQNSSEWPLIDRVLWTAAFGAASAATDGAASVLFAAGGALNPFIFLGQTDLSAPTNIPMNFTYTQNAGWGVIAGCGYADYYYNALGTKYDTTWYGTYNFKPTYMFNVGDSITFRANDGSATTPYVVNYFQYTMVYSVFNSSKNMGFDSFPNLYTGSYTVSAFLPEEVVTTS